MNYIIRPASPDDAEALLAVYAPYITGTAITFECTVPSVADFARRIEMITTRYPYFAACNAETGEIVGYAYAHPYSEREAYAWSAEASIYLSPQAKGSGLGRTLYEKLEEALRSMHIVNLYAVVTCPETDDEYCTHNSVQFHEHVGFKQTGILHNAGNKFGRWYHIVTLEKALAPHVPNPPAVVPIQQ